MRESPDARKLRAASTACAFVALLFLSLSSFAWARQFQQPFLFADRTKILAGTTSGDINGDGKLDLLQNPSGTMTTLLGDGNLDFAFLQNITISTDAALGDVNGDGRPDLVTTTLVKLNNGDGTFGPEHAMLGSGSMVHLADLNADGKLDLVAVTSFDIRVTAGNGDGTFAAFTYPFPIPGTPASLTIADVNGDGKPDALVGTTGKMSVFLGTGSSATWFQPRIDFSTATPTTVDVGDLNEDGNVDLAVASLDNSTVGFIHLGNGNGTFAAATTVPAPLTQYVAIADFNGDSHLDAMFSGGGIVNFFAGVGNGTFASPTSWDLQGFGPFQAVHADNNGTWDVQWGNALLLGNGDGTFGFIRRAAVGAGARRAAVGDVNGDGFMDVAVVNSAAASVTVALGNGDGTLGAPATYATDTNPRNLVLKDVNGDGRADILTANSSPGSVSILLALAGGGFGPKSDISLPSPVPTDLKAEDLNGDGKPDLVIGRFSTSTTGQLSVYLGNGNGTFTLFSHFSGTGSVYEVALADMNGDGKLDAVVGGVSAGGVGLLTIFQGQGNGGLINPHSYGGFYSDQGLGVGDFNQDGKLDAIWSKALYLGNGDGTLGSSTPIPNLALNGGEIAVGDFDRDGKLDVAGIATSNSPPANNVFLDYGDGIGNFPRFEYLGAGYLGTGLGGLVGVEAGQLNVGSDPDLVVTNSAGSNVTVLLNNGLGSQVGTPGPPPPVTTGLARGYPNPAFSAYQVSLELPTSAPVVVSIVDASGRRVKTIESGTLPVGVHRTSWDLVDHDGRRVPAGVYFCEVRVADRVTRTRFAVLR